MWWLVPCLVDVEAGAVFGGCGGWFVFWFFNRGEVGWWGGDTSSGYGGGFFGAGGVGSVWLGLGGVGSVWLGLELRRCFRFS